MPTLQNMQKSTGRQKFMNVLLQKLWLCQQSQWQFWMQGIPYHYILQLFNVFFYVFRCSYISIWIGTSSIWQMDKSKKINGWSGESAKELRALLVVRSLAADQHQILTFQNFASPTSDPIRPPRLERQFSMIFLENQFLEINKNVNDVLGSFDLGVSSSFFLWPW